MKIEQIKNKLNYFFDKIKDYEILRKSEYTIDMCNNKFYIIVDITKNNFYFNINLREKIGDNFKVIKSFKYRIEFSTKKQKEYIIKQLEGF